MANANVATGKKPNLRASAGAVKKRVAARNLNDLLLGKKSEVPLRDGRTEKRRARLLAEVAKDGLKPVDLLLKVQELFDLGESYASMRKVVPVRRLRSVPPGAVEAVASVMAAYALNADVYRFLGLPKAVLEAAGVLRKDSAKKLPSQAMSPKARAR